MVRRAILHGLAGTSTRSVSGLLPAIPTGRIFRWSDASVDTKDMPRALSRALSVALVLLVVGAVWEGLFPFQVETDVANASSRSCIPVLQAWRSEPPRPSNTDLAMFWGNGVPTPAQVRDPQYRAAVAATVQSASFQRVKTWDNWVLGPGACVPGSRHRVHLTELLALAAVLIGGVVIVDLRRTHRSAAVA